MALERETPLEQPVQPDGRATQIMRFRASTALEAPYQGERREQERAEVGDARHAKAGALDDGPESSGRVTTAMTERSIVSAPEPVECRHGDDERASRGERTSRRRQRAPLVVEVLEHVEQEHHVGPSFGDDEIVGNRAAPDVEAV